MLRTGACFTGSGRKRSTTSMTLPNMATRRASRSASFATPAHISSSDFGGLRTSKRPMARAGASAHAATSAMPRTASIPRVSPRCSSRRSGSEYKRMGGASSAPMLADCTSGS